LAEEEPAFRGGIVRSKRHGETSKMKNMGSQFKTVTKAGLIKELQKLQQEYDLLKTAYEKDITKLKRTEEERQAALTKYKTLFNCFPLGITVSDEAGKILESNQTAEKLLGESQDKHVKRNINSPEWSIVRPDGTSMPPDEYASVRAMKERRIVENVEMGIVKPDNTTKWISVTAALLPLKGYGVVIVYNEITESKLAESEIRKSKKSLEDLYRHLNEIRENERALISREIHDELGQSMTALKLDLNRMHKYVGTNPEAIMKLDNMIELVSNTIKDVQRISSDLRPGILDDLGLAAAIEWYSGEFEKRTGIRCRLRLDDSTLGDPQKNLVFFRVLQEALTNVIRHANASFVSIILRQSKQRNTLIIQDNGIGIHQGKVESSKSLGLIGIRERVRQFGGEFVILSKEGNGTKLTVFIPS
jgi:two-component system sensor histidine kinase UhpB